MDDRRVVSSRRQLVAVIGISILIGAILAPLPGFSHVGDRVQHLWAKHIRPKADKRFTSHVTVIPANCPTSVGVTGSFDKIADIGSFDKNSGATKIEATFDGRIRAASMTGNGIRFELRVDDTPGTGRAMGLLRSGEAGSTGVQASFSGLFEGLSKGDHTVSLWAMATNSGTGTDVMWDPGCFGTDKVMVKEFR